MIRDLNQDAEVILDTNREEAIDSTWSEVFSLIGSSVRSKIVSALSGGDVTKLAPFVVSSSEGVSRLVDGIVGPLEDGGVLILRELTEITEPIEMLPTTDELLARVGTDRLTPTESSMCQLLIAPQIESDAELNEEVSHLLNQLVRSTDLVSIYGHSQLSVSMPYTSVSEGKLIAESVLKALTDRFALRDLNYSIGLSYSYPGDQQPFEVFRRASWALKIAQDAGGDRVVVWNEETERDPESFGSETEKQREYHNLVLLWNVLNVVAKSADWEEAGEKICNHMVLSFDLGRAAVLALQNGSLISLVGASRGPKAYEGLEDLAISGDNFLRIQEFFGSDADHIQLEEIHLLKLNMEPHPL